MMNLLPYYEENDIKLYLGDSFKILKKLEPKSVKMIFADPPYFLSRKDGITLNSGKMVSVVKADWDQSLSVVEKHKFNRAWIKLCKNVLDDNGTIWISGTMSNIYSIGLALEQEGFRILNNITWQKLNPPPNISCRYFVHSTETILWAKKDMKNSRHTFNYAFMKQLNGNKQDKDVWTSSMIKKSEKKFGGHPTQKPIWLLEKIILASTNENDLVLDPFSGSGTTCIASHMHNRKFLGIDNVQEYLDITINRINLSRNNPV
jgi:site-specific DNA-methyltransferase (adenine-specific)